MLRTKTKRLIFASVLFFLFLNMFLPVAIAITLPTTLPSGEPLVLPGATPTTTTPGTTTPGTTTPGTTTTTTTTPGTTTTTTTTPTGESSSETGLVQCGNEGQPACTFNDIFTTMGRVIDFILYNIVPALATFGIVWAAIIMMTSEGDPGKFKQGRDAILAIAIGLIIIYLSWFIVKSFIQFLGGQGSTLQFLK